MILALETSSSLGSWALADESRILEHGKFEGRASSSLLPSLEQALGQSGQTPDVILVGVGPGSFGGIRVAIATAQGLATVYQATILPVRSSSAQGWKYKEIANLGIFADAKRGQYFFTGYSHGKLSEPSRLIPKEAADEYARRCDLALSPDPLAGIQKHDAPSASDLILHHIQHGPEEGLALDPIYLHDTVVPKSV